ncbi:hypothetical protein GCM10009738_60290 [Kitasatospora viridis]
MAVLPGSTVVEAGSKEVQITLQRYGADGFRDRGRGAERGCPNGPGPAVADGRAPEADIATASRPNPPQDLRRRAT